MKLLVRFLLGSSLVLCLAIFSIGTHVYALTVPTGLTIAPVRTELQIVPGTVQTGQLTIYNMTTNDMNVTMDSEVFNVINEQYDYSFNATSPVAGWVQFDPTTTILAAGKSKTINYSVNVPAGAEPGGKYISLFASTSIKSNNTAVNSSERVGSLLYITVSGNVSRTGYVLSLFTPWTMINTSMWSATLHDGGTAHFASNYSMSVKTLWNTDVSSYSNSSLILPKTIRLIQGTIAEPKVPGIYKLVFIASLGDSSDAKLERYILYMPIYGWIIISIAVLFIVNRVIRIVQRRREKTKKTT
ncbi:MAG: hypothetical protein JWN26_231 [Candidatus Saccharibacteria bacterium]|nr:hypothetical protein [Candidatus Saccharibacteria bacterium]